MTTLTSNWRPLLRAFYPFLIAIAALWAMPKNAHAQLYVTEVPGDNGGVVDKYDAKTGAAINASFITGLGFPLGLAVLGNKLFVVDFASGTVGKYDATTGEAINANFITGLQFPTGLAVKSAR
jgi:DNA-binding beta-propeller fold protein YncE